MNHGVTFPCVIHNVHRRGTVRLSLRWQPRRKRTLALSVSHVSQTKQRDHYCESCRWGVPEPEGQKPGVGARALVSPSFQPLAPACLFVSDHLPRTLPSGNAASLPTSAAVLRRRGTRSVILDWVELKIGYDTQCGVCTKEVRHARAFSEGVESRLNDAPEARRSVLDASAQPG